MEEEGKEKAMDVKRPGKLNLNAPLLSTKRPGCNYIGEDQEISCMADITRIPFCWEQVPGRPKNLERSDNILEVSTPRPKLPPNRWHPQEPAACVPNYDLALYDQDDGFDAGVDDDDENGEVFSDAVDVLSLTEAIDIVEKAEKLRGSSDGLNLNPKNSDHLDGLTNLESVDDLSGSLSPSYIIQRFLQDATALAAASSALAVSKNLNKKLPYFSNYPERGVSRAVKQSYSSPKGCGLQLLLPWRMKHKICGVKSPVRQDSSIVKQPKCSAKQKKH